MNMGEMGVSIKTRTGTGGFALNILTRKWGKIIVSQHAQVMESLMPFAANMSAVNRSLIILEGAISFALSTAFYLTSPLQWHLRGLLPPSNMKGVPMSA